MGTVRTVLVLGGLLAVAACADAPHGPGATGTDGAAAVELIGSGTVLEDASHGPQLCLGGVAESLPPQCGGPDIPNWKWEDVRGAEHVRGTRWGAFVVIGTYAEGRFTLSRPAVPVEEYDGPPLRPSDGSDDLGTPCPVPEGGWTVVDAGLTTEASLERVAQAAQRLPGYAGLWWDQSTNPAFGDDAPDEETAVLLNDPTKLVVNVRVTGDPGAAEVELRRIWGGALCVTRAQRTESELLSVQERLTGLPGFLTSGTGDDRVEVSVIHDDGSLQRRMDEEHGEGLVRVTSALQPYRR